MTQEKLDQLWQKAQEFPSKFDDITCGSYDYFMRSLSDPNSLFFEIEDALGLVCISNVVVGRSGLFRFVFFDRKIRGREATLNEVMHEAFRIGNLHRLNAAVSIDRELVYNALRRLGFQVEGRLRQEGLVDGKRVDVFIMGILRIELV